MEELRMFDLASTFKSMSSVNPSPKAKGRKCGRKGSHVEGSDSSDYLPEAEENVRGDGDTDLEVEEPEPLAIEAPPRQTRRRKVCAGWTKGNINMGGPGGRQVKRVRPNGPTDGAVGVSTRSSKRLERQEQVGDDVQKDLPLATQDNSGAQNDMPGEGDETRPRSPFMDWSYPENAHSDDVGEEQNPSEQTESRTEVSRKSRKPRPAIRGVLLDSMTRAMGKRLPISVAEGMPRPHEPVQAAKFASEAGVIVRAQVPILTHWKEYKKDNEHFERFVSRLGGRLAIDDNDMATAEACSNVFKSGIRQARYRLKQLCLVKYLMKKLMKSSMQWKPSSYAISVAKRVLVMLQEKQL